MSVFFGALVTPATARNLRVLKLEDVATTWEYQFGTKLPADIWAFLDELKRVAAAADSSDRGAGVGATVSPNGANGKMDHVQEVTVLEAAVLLGYKSKQGIQRLIDRGELHPRWDRHNRRQLLMKDEVQTLASKKMETSRAS